MWVLNGRQRFFFPVESVSLLSYFVLWKTIWRAGRTANAAVLKTVVRKDLGVRIPRPPLGAELLRLHSLLPDAFPVLCRPDLGRRISTTETQRGRRSFHAPLPPLGACLSRGVFEPQRGDAARRMVQERFRAQEGSGNPGTTENG